MDFNNISNVSRDQEEEEMLDFQTAMRDFTAMFPRLTYGEIEQVLRKYEGDVSATLNELLFDNNLNNNNSQMPVVPRFAAKPGEDELSRLKMRRNDIDMRLRENQKLLDTVVDVETARTYEDQQLALCLEYREINELIKAEKQRLTPSNAQIARNFRRKTTTERPARNNERETRRGRISMDEERIPCPEGPYVGEQMHNSNDIKTKIGSMKKASMTRLTRFFSSP